jgi:hypothetical protein
MASVEWSVNACGGIPSTLQKFLLVLQLVEGAYIRGRSGKARI